MRVAAVQVLNMSDTIDVSIEEPADEHQYEHHARKRRRSLRKGTHSCWACRRRKEKCSYEDGDVCTGCLRRGTKCVSQRFADNEAPQATTATATSTATDTRLERIEDMVAQLTSQLQPQNQAQMYTPPMTGPGTSPAPSAPLPQAAQPASTIYSVLTPLVVGGDLVDSTTTLASTARLQVLSQALHSSLPCPQDIQLLRNASARHPVLSTIHITTSYSTLRRDGIQPTHGVLPEPPLVTAEPVLLARYMLQLAICLQEMPSITYPELTYLVEPASTLTERCANTAMNLVTRQDDLLGSIESLEGVILESVYQCNSGRLRLSWMAVQRAIRLAQTMGLHQIGSNSSSSPRDTFQFLDPSGTRAELPHLWFRIVHYDLQLSRMLGLPPGVTDASRIKIRGDLSSSDVAVETPEGCLEQAYSHVMILALAQRSSEPGPPDVKATQALDQELQRAANSAPSHWWLPPNLAESSQDPVKLFWDMRRLITQMLHHDLRTQLNVPYMLARGEGDKHRSEMARIACVHSSREVLSRFILLRDFNRTVFSCRFANFLGLMAAITLVLAHLGSSGRRPPSQNQDAISSQVDSLLAHQAPSDRAMMEQALENMRSMNRSSGDALCEQSANVLYRLLDIQAKNSLYITEGNAYVSAQAQADNLPPTTAASNSGLEDGERIFVPYFGVMRIVRPYEYEVAREANAAMALNPRVGSESTHPQAHETMNFVDPLLLDLRDEHWMSQNIDMTFLDAFLEGTISEPR
jgi:hypothetical protein